MHSTKADYQSAIQKAHELLEKYNIQEPVVNVFELAQRNGMDISFFAPKEESLEKISGFLSPNSKTIYINSSDPPNRQVFTVAHEMGHQLLGHAPDEYDVLFRYENPIDKDPLQQEANCFAANLLVPSFMLKNTIEKYKIKPSQINLLAKMFGVSPVLIKYRMQWLNQPI